jgi:hypothetical protein
MLEALTIPLELGGALAVMQWLKNKHEWKKLILEADREAEYNKRCVAADERQIQQAKADQLGKQNEQQRLAIQLANAEHHKTLALERVTQAQLALPAPHYVIQERIVEVEKNKGPRTHALNDEIDQIFNKTFIPEICGYGQYYPARWGENPRVTQSKGG